MVRPTLLPDDRSTQCELRLPVKEKLKLFKANTCFFFKANTCFFFRAQGPGGKVRLKRLIKYARMQFHTLHLPPRVVGHSAKLK